LPAATPASPDLSGRRAGASDPAVSLDQIVSMWPAVIEALKTYSRVAWMGFEGSVPISLSNGVLAVAMSDAGRANNVKVSGHDERLRLALIDVLRADVRIDIVLAPDRAGTASATGSKSTTGGAVAESDAPSMDDADTDESVGVDLALRELGAVQIGEIDH
jgi:DNA polymerase-3 subunit gamma/tau